MCELRAVSSKGGCRRHKLRDVALEACSFVLWVCGVAVGDRIAVNVFLHLVGGGVVGCLPFARVWLELPAVRVISSFGPGPCILRRLLLNSLSNGLFLTELLAEVLQKIGPANKF